MAWTGTKALYQGAKSLGRELGVLGKAQVVERQIPNATRNSYLAGKPHPITGIPFDKNGFPVFDKIAKHDVKITGDLGKMTSEQHMEAATRQLKADIAAGKVDKKLFNRTQLAKIEEGVRKIPGYTWHHHQHTGRMQLVDEIVHAKTGHDGGMKFWFIKE
jgi:hypothetical protein